MPLFLFLTVHPASRSSPQALIGTSIMIWNSTPVYKSTLVNIVYMNYNLAKYLIGKTRFTEFKLPRSERSV